MLRSLVGSEMCIRDRCSSGPAESWQAGTVLSLLAVTVAVQVPQNPGRHGNASLPRGWCSSGPAESWQAGTVLPPLLLLQFRFHRILAGCERPPLQVAGSVQAQQNPGRQGQFSLPCCCCSSGSTESWLAGTFVPPLLLLQFRFHRICLLYTSPSPRDS